MSTLGGEGGTIGSVDIPLVCWAGTRQKLIKILLCWTWTLKCSDRKEQKLSRVVVF